MLEYHLASCQILESVAFDVNILFVATAVPNCKIDLQISSMRNGNYRLQKKQRVTSDAGSQYRWGRVGRDIRSPSPPNAPPPTHTLKRSFLHFWTCLHGSDQRTDDRTDGQRQIQRL